jgi:hypothetical protein
MIRRSERIVRQEVNGTATTYRVTRIHVFGCCVYLGQVELNDPWMTPRRPATRPAPDDTAEFPARPG